MDGVIIDSELEYLKYDLEFARTKNPLAKLEDLYGMVGASREDAWSVMERAVHNGQSWEELRDEYYSFCDVYSHMDYRRIFRPEIRGILETAHSLGLKLALASSTQMSIIRQVLDENDIGRYFQVVVSGAQFKRSKPDPEIYFYTASQLEVNPEECFVVEDSTFGIAAAKAAGMKVAALADPRFQFDQSPADLQIGSLQELPEILVKILC